MSARDREAAQLDSLPREKQELLKSLLENRSRRADRILAVHRDQGTLSVREPTSWSQQRLWFIDQLEAGHAGYQVALAIRLKGDVDGLALQKALDTIVQRHQVLRTVFVSEEGEPVQEITLAGCFLLESADVSELSPNAREAELRRQRIAETHRRFDLRVGPLIRGRLLRLSSQEHVLLVTMHHIISDGWSIGVYIKELAILYSAYREGRGHSLTPLPIQYADYARWQRDWLQGSVLEKQLQYWRTRLQGAPPQLELPTDRPRPPTQSYQGANVEMVLTAELTARLRDFARTQGMTLFMVLYAGWAILMSRLSGQSDVVIGTPIANRRRPELEGLIGFFVNTLALRVEVMRDRPLQELLQQVKTVSTDAYAHQDLPFEKLVEALQPQRDLRRNPVFQVMLALQSTPKFISPMSGLSLSLEEGVDEPAIFDLFLSLEERGTEVVGSLNYATDLFDRSTVDRWLASFSILLDEMTGDARRRVKDLRFLPQKEREAIFAFNETCRDFPHDKLIHQLFEAQVEQAPNEVAAIHGDHRLTYAELNTQASQLAGYLLSRGAGPDQLVGLCVERGLQMVVALLGILKAGSAYLPLDPNYPQERLEYMVEDAAPLLVLTQGRLRGRLPVGRAGVIELDRVWSEVAAGSGGDPSAVEPKLSSNQLLYVIYTSGSTGRPKGTAMPHRAMVNLIEWHRGTFAVRYARRVLQFAALSFDVAFQEIFSTMCTGGTLVLLDEEIRRDVGALAALLRNSAIETLFVPPLMLQGLAEYMSSSDWVPEFLRDVITAGEQLRITPEIVSLFKRLKTCRLHNHYGPTETHVVTALTLTGDPGTWPALPSIGRPIDNTQIHILDGELEPMPIGVAGDIYIGGVGLARGYLARPELTAERFITDPFNAASEARLYRTGDLGRWQADGTLEYLGRNDHQVKIRGYRIELGEIEAQLMRHPQVKEAAVIAREGSPGVKVLVAYIVRGEGNASASDLRTYLKGVLPEYMIPGAFVALTALPLTPSGKLNRQALPRAEGEDYAGQSYEPPTGDVEEALAEIWRSLLTADPIGRDDSFFDLGGHSLLVIKMLFRVNQRLGSNLGVSDTYQSPTIRALAMRLQGQGQEDPFINLSQESTLGQIRVTRGTPLSDEPGVLLTGATGFVGRFLLHQLLADSTATIYCLVRTRGHQHQPLTRLKEVLGKWGLWSREYERRIVAVPANLAHPRLGLDERWFTRLCQEVGRIYHCGASMNHLETYESARPANVDGIRQLVAIAAEGRLKVINYISTLGVFSSVGSDQTREVEEESPIDFEKHRRSSGYLASKWVGEKIVMRARDLGIPCNVFRLGLVWADSVQGRYDELQDGYRLLKTCLHLGVGIEHFRYDTAPLPVDQVVRSIVSLAHRCHSSAGRTFHIASGAGAFEDVFERCNQVAGTSLTLMPLTDWVQHVRRAQREGLTVPVAPLLELYERETEAHSGAVQPLCNKTLQELGRAGYEVGALDDVVLGLTVANMPLWDGTSRKAQVSN